MLSPLWIVAAVRAVVLAVRGVALATQSEGPRREKQLKAGAKKKPKRPAVKRRPG